jgi:hypothetical protein
VISEGRIKDLFYIGKTAARAQQIIRIIVLTGILQ